MILRDRKNDRYSSRRWLWHNSHLRSVRGCGRGLQDAACGMVIGITLDRSAVVQGVNRCGSIWAEPLCSAKIRAHRADEFGRLIAKHVQAGGTALFVTLTARHYYRHQLESLFDTMKSTWKLLISGKGWITDRNALGIIGLIRCDEVTFGLGHGWHPHHHVVVLLGATQHPRPSVPRKKDRPVGWTMPEWDPHPTGYFTPDLAKVAGFKARWERLWIARLAEEGLTPNQEHGIQWDEVESVRDAEKIGEYLAKTQDGKNVGNELARGDLKKAKGRESMAPFEMLRRIRDLAGGMVPEELPGVGDLDVLVPKWHEYEHATKGRRAMEASRYLRAAYDMDQDGDDGGDDGDLVYEDDGRALEYGAAFPAEAWTAICKLGIERQAEEALEVGGFAALVALMTEVHISHEGVTELDAAGIAAKAEERRAAMAKKRDRDPS